MEFDTGPISALLEASATAVGVGMVLGGFAAGLAGVLNGTDRDGLERQVVAVGYLAAAFCLVARLAEMAPII